MSRLPAVRDGTLLTAPSAAPVAVGSPEWFAWLDCARSFTYAGPAGTFTARHETRSARRFWYAYRQRDGALRKAYLGRSADLTLDRLQSAARSLADGTGTPGSAPRAAPDDWSSPLIATKIAVPQPGPALIARPAVLARCLEAVERPCAIVAAPPGFGKTTLLIEACARLCERGWQIAWVSLEEAERDPARFWAYILAALGAARPGVDAARRLLEMPRPSPADRMLTALVNALAADPTPIALVLDDYHRAASEASDAGLAFLVEHAPAALHLVVAARGDPAFPLARLRAQGRISELHAADLRFSTDDAGRFLRETMRLSLPAERLVRLAERTEGWPAGLQLAALSLREQSGTGDTLDVPDLPAATPQYIAEYLIAEVLEHQPADVQEFLLRTAPLERLTGPLCDAVTGRDDGAAMLARLMQAQLFVTPLDPARTWYRYHHLFAEVLRDHLAQTAPETLTQIHRRAADWLRGQGMTDEAIRHLLAARAFDDAAALIEGEADARILRGEVAGLVAQASALPRDVVLAHPHLSVLFAVALLLRGEMPESAALLAELERRLPELGASAAETRLEIGVVRAVVLLMGGDFLTGLALVREAAQRLPASSTLLRSLALWLTGIIGVLGDEDMAGIVRGMTDIVAESLRAGSPLVAYLALVTRGGIEMYQARLCQAAQTCREALRLVPGASGREQPIAAMGYSVLGEIHREWNELDAADEDLRRALAIGMDLTNREFLDDGLMALGMVHAARGEYDAALATFAEIAHLVRTQQLSPWDMDLMEFLRVRVLIMQGQVAEVARWAEERRHLRREPQPIMLLALLRELEELALARASLALGDPAAVIAPLEAVCAQAAPAGRLRNVLDARMLLARAHWMAGDAGAALRELDAALALAAPENFQRVFLDEGAPMADLLAAYVAARPPSRERAHALTLLGAFGRAVGPDALPAGETLSPRELDVLRLLAAGRSNDAIAAELVVARSTVKWHVAQIYRKLGVGGRVQAVARARELHLVA